MQNISFNDLANFVMFEDIINELMSTLTIPSNYIFPRPALCVFFLLLIVHASKRQDVNCQSSYNGSNIL